MRKLIGTAALIGGCLASSMTSADDPHGSRERGPAGIAVGEPLISARTRLLKHGWRPVPRHAADDYEYSGAELQLIEHAILEVDACSVDSARCIFYYSRKRKCLRVDTIGEQLRDMKVTRWAEECPDPSSSAGRVDRQH